MKATIAKERRPGTREKRTLLRHPWCLAITVFSLGWTIMVSRVGAQDSNVINLQPLVVVGPEEQNGSQATTLLQLEAAVRADPRNASSIVTQSLGAEQPGTITFAGQAVGAAIRGLGSQARRIPVGRIILAVVKERPGAVLEMIRVAIRQTGKDVHPQIVANAAAGVAAVSDPDMPICVKLVESAALGYEYCQSTSPSRVLQAVGGLTFVQGATLTETIVQVAFQSGSNESLAALSRSANIGLQRQGTPDPFAAVGQWLNRYAVSTALATQRITNGPPANNSTPPPIATPPPIDITPIPTPPPVSP